MTVTDPQGGIRHVLADGLVRTLVGDAYVVEGGPTRTPFTGPGAVDVLPDLCDLLDGSRSDADLAKELDLLQEDVEEAVALLREHGLAEALPPGHTPDGGPDEARAFLSRSIGYALRTTSSVRATEALRSAPVVLAGSGPLADELRDVLHRQGVSVGDFSARLVGELPPHDGASLPTAVVVQVFASDEERSPDILEQCRQRGVLWLGAAADGGGGFVGPMVHPGFACSTCACAALPPREDGEPRTGAVRLLAGLLAGEVVNGLAGIGSCPTAGGFVRVSWSADGEAAARVETEPVLRRVDCARCGAAQRHTDRRASQTLWEYEQQIDVAPPPFAVPAQFIRKPDTKALQRTKRDLPTSPVLHGDSGMLDEAFAILRRTVGVRQMPSDEVPLRCMPSAGNLNSQQAFVVSRSPIPELGTHAAWFDATLDALVATGRVAADEVRTALAPVLGETEWSWLLVWVADVGKLSAKYRDFAVRLGFLDAGVALAQTCVAAEALLGSAPRMLSAWQAESFASLLDLNLRTEAVTGVLIF
ncbi:hypothetical protein ACFV2H_32790 [Streptomyces sp. NPDC059629]|uniref:hypothetical protein n=1 Tax=Streptomyces sp. NPDC059629 TaxID=3346889 RepID=UPI0036B6EF32